MHTKKYDAITVSDIIRRSGVSRSGFYRNYKSKDEVLDEIALRLKERLDKGEGTWSDDVREYVRNVFEMIASGEESCNLILGADVPPSMLFRVEKFFEMKARGLGREGAGIIMRGHSGR